MSSIDPSFRPRALQQTRKPITRTFPLDVWNKQVRGVAIQPPGAFPEGETEVEEMLSEEALSIMEPEVATDRVPRWS